MYVTNMTFDNSSPPPSFDNSPIACPTRSEQIRSHVPIVLLAGGFVALFISLHTAALTVAIVAGAHMAIGAIALAFGVLRSKGAATGRDK